MNWANIKFWWGKVYWKSKKIYFKPKINQKLY